MEIDADAMMRESAARAGEMFNRILVLTGENAALRQRVAALEKENQRYVAELLAALTTKEPPCPA
jgi:uncharacterized NAD(P)/FAD-binding protein YdhS